MTPDRRDFLRMLAAAAAAGLPLGRGEAASAAGGRGFYELPRFGNVSLLHFTDTHAQLLPIWFREPNVNIGMGAGYNRAPHLVGEALLKAFGIRPGTREAHAFTSLDFARAALTFGKVGGYAHLAELVKQLLAERPAGIKGLSVPGMPVGSPGMDGPVPERYIVYSFDARGKPSVYAQR